MNQVQRSTGILPVPERSDESGYSRKMHRQDAGPLKSSEVWRATVCVTGVSPVESSKSTLCFFMISTEQRLARGNPLTRSLSYLNSLPLARSATPTGETPVTQTLPVQSLRKIIGEGTL